MYSGTNHLSSLNPGTANPELGTKPAGRLGLRFLVLKVVFHTKPQVPSSDLTLDGPFPLEADFPQTGNLRGNLCHFGMLAHTG